MDADAIGTERTSVPARDHMPRVATPDPRVTPPKNDARTSLRTLRAPAPATWSSTSATRRPTTSSATSGTTPVTRSLSRPVASPASRPRSFIAAFGVRKRVRRPDRPRLQRDRIYAPHGGFQGGGRKLVCQTTEGHSLPNYGRSTPSRGSQTRSPCKSSRSPAADRVYAPHAGEFRRSRRATA
jgi:hypothetical protein